MTASVELQIDLHADHLSVRDAATVCGVTEASIRQWKRRGHLKPAGLDEFGRFTYRGIDVLRAQARAEANAARTRATLSVVSDDGLDTRQVRLSR